MSMIIARPDYLNRIKAFQGRSLIKVLTGMRRVGKSTLLKQIQESLLNEGVKESQIIQINMEEMENEPLTDYHRLYEHIQRRLQKDQMNYIFIDEVQEVNQFEKVLNSLQAKGNADIFVTGSNSQMLSGELATRLSGRYVEIQVYPFSYKEYLKLNELKPGNESLQEWLQTGGLPAAGGLSSEAWREYLSGIYHTVLLKDIVQRKKFTDVALLESLSQYLADNISNQITPKGIADFLTSAGRKTTSKTIGNYLSALKEAFLLNPVQRSDLRGKKIFDRGRKYYFTDTGLRQYLIGGRLRDLGRLLENAVCTELKRRGYDVSSGDWNGLEVDFVARKGSEVQYYQVSASVLDEAAYDREIRPFLSIQDNYPKILLSLDSFDLSDKGIRHQNLLDFFLENET